MYIVRDIFDAKPGKAKDLVAVFKDTRPHMKDLGIHNLRLLTDLVADYWTVVVEFEVEELSVYFDLLKDRPEMEKIGEIMKGYMELVNGGHREIFKVEE